MMIGCILKTQSTAIESNGGIKVNEAKVLQTDVLTDNSGIHIIDKVLISALVATE